MRGCLPTSSAFCAIWSGFDAVSGILILSGNILKNLKLCGLGKDPRLKHTDRICTSLIQSRTIFVFCLKEYLFLKKKEFINERRGDSLEKFMHMACTTETKVGLHAREQTAENWFTQHEEGCRKLTHSKQHQSLCFRFVENGWMDRLTDGCTHSLLHDKDALTKRTLAVKLHHTVVSPLFVIG